MGSIDIWSVLYRKGFAFIGHYGYKEAVDKAAGKGARLVSVTQVF